MKHLMIDCETLGVHADAVVLSIGACVFEFKGEVSESGYQKIIDTGIHIKFSVTEQMKMGRAIEDDTMHWWRKQSAEAREILEPSDTDLSVLDGMLALNEWLKKSGYDYDRSFCWSRGTYFDFPKFYSMYNQVNVPAGYNGWKIRDTRTYIDVLTGGDRGVYKPKFQPKGFVAHNALHDAAFESIKLMEIYQENS